jgi:alkylated DNA repair dioxygenase AlkB
VPTLTTTPFQPSLLAAGPPDAARPLHEARHTDLGRGAWVDVLPAWVGGADALFTALHGSVPWRHREVPMYGRVVPEPRLTAWWADDEDGPTALDRAPEALRRLLPLLGEHYGQPFDCIGLNLYRDGRDSVAWHGDRTERGRPVTTVAVLSLGSPRRFLLRPTGGGPSRATWMFSGDLLVMGGTCQHTWEHSIPKVAHAGPRMSVTFRHRRPRPSPRTER